MNFLLLNCYINVLNILQFLHCYHYLQVHIILSLICITLRNKKNATPKKKKKLGKVKEEIRAKVKYTVVSFVRPF